MKSTDHQPTRSSTFPSRIGAHAPNLATLDQLRSRGRNPLLSPATPRHRAAAKGCTTR